MTDTLIPAATSAPALPPSEAVGRVPGEEESVPGIAAAVPARKGEDPDARAEGVVGALVTLQDASSVKGGAEFGMSRFCDQSFINPDSTRTGSQALLTAFDDSGLWLASLVQPVHLVAELRQQCCLLARVVITQWTHQGEMQKMARLADALVEATPPVDTHEAGQILALLASLLGVLRPAQAPRWLEASRPLLRDSTDPHLLKEAAQWVAVGQLLTSLTQEERVFWNRRLRDPLDDWGWEIPEALEALRHIRPLLTLADENLHLFQAAVPRCWWELWRERVQQPAAAVAKIGTESHSTGAGDVKGGLARIGPMFALGVACGIGAASVFVAMGGAKRFFPSEVSPPSPPVFSFHEVEPASSREGGSARSGEAVLTNQGTASGSSVVVRPMPTPHVPMVAQTPGVLAGETRAVTASSSGKEVAGRSGLLTGAVSPAAAEGKLPVKEADVAPTSAGVAMSPAMDVRLAESARLAKAHPDLERLHSLVKMASSLREAVPHVQGQTMVAPQGSRQHRTLLRWLMLDPPVNAEVREQVAKAAVRVLPARDMFETLQMCLHPGSPNLAEARQCAELFLALGGEGLNDEEKRRLTAAAQ